MEIKLMKNEILHLSESLRIVSQELITLQNFITREFGRKYQRFCETEKDEGTSRKRQCNGNIASVSSSISRQDNSFGSGSCIDGSRPRRNVSWSSVESVPTVSASGIHHSESLLVQDHDDPDDENSEASNQPVFTAWKTEIDEEDIDLYIPGSDVEEDLDNRSSSDQEETSRKRKINETTAGVSKPVPPSHPVSLLKFVKSTNRGKDMVALEGYMYHSNNSQEKTDYYMCNDRKKGCKSRLIVKKDLAVFQQKGSHSHAPNPDRVRAQEVLAAGKQLAVENPNLPMNQVMSRIESMIVEDPTVNAAGSLGLGNALYVKRRMLRARAKGNSSSASKSHLQMLSKSSSRATADHAIGSRTENLEDTHIPPFGLSNLQAL